MKTLSLALAATAIAATSGTFATAAHAGGRGGGHFGFRFHQFQQSYIQRAREDEEEYAYIRRRKAIAAAKAAASKPAVVAEKKPAVVVARYADGQGRQFDLTSKVWFDGKNQCWMGSKPFLFKAGSWSYGEARWTQSDGTWRVASGEMPEQVSCDGIQAFAGKLQTNEVKPVAKVIQAKPAKIETSEAQIEKPKVVATTAPAKPTDCKKYFPSVGEMVSVPCE